MPYNGWKNRETWAVALWLTNDEVAYHNAMELVQGKSPEQAAADLRDRLQEEASRRIPEASLWADLIQGALSEVDWLEVAKALLEE